MIREEQRQVGRFNNLSFTLIMCRVGLLTSLYASLLSSWPVPQRQELKFSLIPRPCPLRQCVLGLSLPSLNIGIVLSFISSRS